MKEFVVIIIAVAVNRAWYKWDKSHESGTRREEWEDAANKTHDRAVLRGLVSFLIVLILCSGPLTLAH